MRKLFQIIVLSLLMVAIPLQGYAATTMLLCAEKTPNAATPQHGQAAHSTQHQHDEMVADMHDHHGVSIHSHASHHDDGKCSLCAACCVGAGITATVFQPFPAEMPSSEIITFHSAHFYRTTPERLERPPVSPLL